MYGVYSDARHDGQKNRRDKHDNGKSFHKHPEEEQKQDNHAPDDCRIAGNGKHSFCNDGGDLILYQETPEGIGGKHDDQHAARDPARRFQRL